MKVKALKLGYLGMLRRRVGDVFDCEERQFSKKWMVEVGDDGKPLASKKDAKPKKSEKAEEPSKDDKSSGKGGKGSGKGGKGGKSSGDKDVI